MIFRLGNRKAAVQQTQHSCYLPIELHERILTECIDDPLMTFKELTVLRLVCKQFDKIIASKILSDISLFGKSDSVWSNLRQLENLLSLKQTAYSRGVKTVRIVDWDWISGSRSFMSWNEMPILSIFILLNTLIVVGHLCRPFILPHTMPRRIYKKTLRFYARLRLSETFKPRLKLPEVKKIIWSVKAEPDWVIASTVRVLQEFPQLDELVLNVDEGMKNMGSFACRVSKLNKLRKLDINAKYTIPGKVDPGRSWAINELGKIIGANPDLTHLELGQESNGENIDLVYMFSYIPKNRPLKLEHIGIHNTFWGPQAIIPHTRQLNSFHFSDSQYATTLLTENVFPPVMSFGSVDEHTIEYLNRHPKITSLSFSNSHANPEIFEIMARHSETLTEYGAYADSNFWCLDEICFEQPFLRCINLKRIVFHTRRRQDNNFDPLNITPKMAAALSVISRLGSSPNMVFGRFGYFKGCQEYCRESDNPLLRDLAKRMVYDGPRQKGRSSV